MPDETILNITPIGLPPYSVRGVTETLSPIVANLERTANGGFVDLTPPQFRKYKVVLTCEDMDSPALDGIWPGAQLVIDCLTELPFLTGGSPEAVPQRTAVSGSERTEGDFTFYRPQLTVRVTQPWQIVTDEYGARVGWQMECEEE